MTVIHPSAIVEPGAQLGADCDVQAFAIVKQWAVLGDRVQVHHFAAVGGNSQDLKFDPATFSGARIGAGTKIRESVTVHRATHPNGFTEVGENCLLMACSHVAHDCVVGNNVVIANAVLLAGHVTVGDNVILGGGACFHQFTRIGEGAIVGGNARITQDLPPFTMAAERDQVIGLNLIGLKRRGVALKSIRQLKEAFRAVYFAPGNIRELAAAALAGGTFDAPEARRFLGFFSHGTRGFARPRRESRAEEGD